MKIRAESLVDGRIQEVYDILSFSPDRSSISARNHRIRSFITIWLGIVIVVAFSVRPSMLMMVAIIAGFVIAMITLHINKRQMSSTQD